MIVGSQSAYGGAGNPLHAKPLTEDQTQNLTSLLEGYDAENMTEEDAKSLVSSISEMGIPPGKALGEAMAANGFDAKAIGALAGAPPPDGGRGPGGPGGAGGPGGGSGGPGGPGGAESAKGQASVDEAILSLIEEAAAAYESSDGDTSFQEALSVLLEEEGYDPSKSLVDFYS